MFDQFRKPYAKIMIDMKPQGKGHQVKVITKTNKISGNDLKALKVHAALISVILRISSRDTYLARKAYQRAQNLINGIAKARGLIEA